MGIVFKIITLDSRYMLPWSSLVDTMWLFNQHTTGDSISPYHSVETHATSILECAMTGIECLQPVALFVSWNLHRWYWPPQNMHIQNLGVDYYMSRDKRGRQRDRIEHFQVLELVELSKFEVSRSIDSCISDNMKFHTCNQGILSRKNS